MSYSEGTEYLDRSHNGVSSSSHGNKRFMTQHLSPTPHRVFDYATTQDQSSFRDNTVVSTATSNSSSVLLPAFDAPPRLQQSELFNTYQDDRNPILPQLQQLSFDAQHDTSSTWEHHQRHPSDIPLTQQGSRHQVAPLLPNEQEHGSHPDARATSSYECTPSSQQHYNHHRWFTRDLCGSQHVERDSPLPVVTSNHHRTRKKAPNAFFVFSSEQRPKIRAEQPRIRSSELNRLLGREWNRLSEESKMRYKQQAQVLKQQEADNSDTSSSGVDKPWSSLDDDDKNTEQVCHNAVFVASYLRCTASSTCGSSTSSTSSPPSSSLSDWPSGQDIQHVSESPSPQPITGGRNMVNVASHSAAAEAEALANFADGSRLALKPDNHLPERVKRPPNAYLLFNRDMRRKILYEHHNLGVAEISRTIGERWRNLSQEEKAHYNEEAAKLKQQHLDVHPNMIYNRRSKAELARAGYRSRPCIKKRQQQQSQSKSRPVQMGRDPRGRKKKRLHNPTAPKHPMSGFLFFSMSVRGEIAALMPKANVGQVSKVVAERWRQMTVEERSPWNKKADEDKARYAREIEAFNAAAASTSTRHGDHQHASDTARAVQARPNSPVELDSQTIATVAQMVNPPRDTEITLLPSLSESQQYRILPATPPSTT